MYAKFEICNGTNDFILNLAQPSTRFFTVDFSKILLGGDPGAVEPTGPVGAWFINLDRAAISSGSYPTLMNVSLVGSNSAYVLYCGTQGSPYAAFGTLCSIADNHSDTSIVQVTVAPFCASWTIAPVPLPATSALPGNLVAGLVEAIRSKGNATLISGGQYSMPFTITLTRNDHVVGCTGLPK